MDEPDAVPIRARLRYPISVRFAPCAALAAPIFGSRPYRRLTFVQNMKSLRGMRMAVAAIYPIELAC